MLRVAFDVRLWKARTRGVARVVGIVSLSGNLRFSINSLLAPSFDDWSIRLGKIV